MSKDKIQYICKNCQATAIKWSGQCTKCHNWNCLEQIKVALNMPDKMIATNYAGSQKQSEVMYLSQIKPQQQIRNTTNISELDRVLGGGLVIGSVVLIGGDPGIGKSTLLLQAAINLSTTYKVLYITGEESLQQVSLRSKRLEMPPNDLMILCETGIEHIQEITAKHQPQVLVIDSIQTIYSTNINSSPGSVSQVKECTAALVRFAKQTQTSVFIIGHVTKEGAIAGPRILEHMVDTVLYFEGDSNARFRIIRCVKNRFGAADEIGVFVMSDKGLLPVSNPSAIFLSQHSSDVSGSVIMVTYEGTRPLLLEIQALVDVAYGQTRRLTLGLDHNRLAMLLAVLHQHTGLAMFDQDVYINIVGGVRINETAADLAVVCACISSFKKIAISNKTIIFGEIGLAGEIRPVPNGEQRLQEALKHGYTHAIIPRANHPKNKIKNMNIVSIDRLSQVIDHIL
ncbi:MAG: DNA repair protein RadA [Gammaproteobacteria bacterium]|nr:MAG: DNA repair protein RadA [Gammaproteobacteria bacterium]